MNLLELKNWVNSLPEEFNNFSVVNGEMIELPDDYIARLDKPVTTLSVDVDNKEICIFNDQEND
jgi:hypothetical protein